MSLSWESKQSWKDEGTFGKLYRMNIERRHAEGIYFYPILHGCVLISVIQNETVLANGKILKHIHLNAFLLED